MNHAESDTGSERHSTLFSAYMHSAFFLTGVGILMLGPLLPRLTAQWNLLDSESGMLLAAQFAGSYTGAVLLQSELRNSLALGNLCMAAGYAGLAFAAYLHTTFLLGVTSLLVGGFGIGQLINSINLIAGRSAEAKRGAKLMSLNLTWSSGALLAPLLIGLVRNRLSLHTLLTIFALCSLLLFVFWLSAAPARGALAPQAPETSELVDTAHRKQGSLRLLAYFAALFFLYGGFENSISGWLATFAVRYAHASVALGAYSTTMLWVGITAGRAFALLMLRRFSEKTLQLAAVIAAILAAALLHAATGATLLLFSSAVVGFCLAPFIPVTSSLFIGTARPRARAAGFVMASAALGAAVLQWLVGIVSQHSGSLKLALGLPAVIGLLLLALCLPSSSRHFASTRS
ncbi:MAG TPA: MFS transporter [Acidobacteriaceae bacterium]